MMKYLPSSGAGPDTVHSAELSNIICFPRPVSIKFMDADCAQAPQKSCNSRVVIMEALHRISNVKCELQNADEVNAGVNEALTNFYADLRYALDCQEILVLELAKLLEIDVKPQIVRISCREKT